MFEQLELLLVFRICFQDGCSVERLHAVFIEVRYLVCEEETIDTFVLIVRSNCDE